MAEGVDPEVMQSNLEARTGSTPDAQAQRQAIREAIAFKKYEFDAHGVEMNQRYDSCAVETDGQPDPGFEKDAELHYQPTTWPGARIPHVWVFDHDTGNKHSTLDLCGRGEFTIFTGIGGEAWVAAARAVSAELGMPIRCHVIGPRQTYVDHTGDWARASEISDTGCLLVRPDQHVCVAFSRIARRCRSRTKTRVDRNPFALSEVGSSLHRFGG